MYTFVFFPKIGWCGLYSGAPYSPEITVYMDLSGDYLLYTEYTKYILLFCIDPSRVARKHI